MFLRLNHQNLVAYKCAKDMCMECYKIVREFPAEEKYNLVQQIRRASISVILNLSEGSSRKSVAERKRFYEIARGSVIELDAAFEICHDLGYLNKVDCNHLGLIMKNTFGIISKLINQ